MEKDAALNSGFLSQITSDSSDTQGYTLEDFDGDGDEPPSQSQHILNGHQPANPMPFFIHKNIFNNTPVSRVRSFRKKHYPSITNEQWNDWRWQLHNRILDAHTLSLILKLSREEKDAVWNSGTALPLSITPYYASLLHGNDPGHPVRRTVIPTVYEHTCSIGESDDPLHEEKDSPVPGLVHRYPDRVLFLVTDFCSTYCRYCTRSRMVGRSDHQFMNRKNWEMALAYIESRPEVRDVLLSGGDPLTLSDEALEWLLSRLRKIPHVEIIRIGTKVPAVLPQRITSSLLKVLKKYHPIWMNIHFTHPMEITRETRKACERLSSAGIPLGSQTVLLKGINDSVEVLKELYHKLLTCRVRPYYLYQCDPISGSSHFRTPVATGLKIIEGLRGHTTGMAVPHFVIDAPGGGGKIPLLPAYCQGAGKGTIILRNYENRYFTYPDTCDENFSKEIRVTEQ